MALGEPRGARGLRVLVTGGAGYIGSFVVRHLLDAGHAVTVYDNLYAGNRWAAQEAELVVADMGDRERLDAVLGAGFDAVVHCAAHIWVGESVRDPAKYYRNNTAGAVALFDGCARHGVRHVVFSSTAAVYGEPDLPLIPETTPLAPINPYGASKMMAERVLADVAAAHGLTHATLRYFNVAGADADARIGEATPDNSHLVKVACETAAGLRPGMRINGTDYPTPDGTCVRDYVHVADLAHSHVVAAQKLAAGEKLAPIYNLGSGNGSSVKEIMDAVRDVTGIDFTPEIGPRRAGDPARIVATGELAGRDLEWTMRNTLRDMVASAWSARQAAGDGYPRGT